MSKRVKPLSSAALAAFKPHPQNTLELVDGAVPGLRVRITPAGTKSWSLNIRRLGKMCRFLVGTNLGLSEARVRALEMRRDVAAGADPTEIRRSDRRKVNDASNGVGTLSSVVDAYFSIGAGAALITKGAQIKCIRLVFKKYLRVVALNIKSSELQTSVDEYRAKVTAARAAAYITPVLRWAAKRDLVSDAFTLEKPHTNAPKQRVLTDGELSVLLPLFTDSFGECSRFMLMTGVRLTATCSARWSDIDLVNKVWTVPPEQQKDTRKVMQRRQKPLLPLVIPLSRQAIELLHEVKIKRQSNLSWGSADFEGDDFVFVTSRGRRLVNWDRWLKKMRGASGVEDWSAHAFRRTVATIAGNLGAPPHIISVILGHANVGGQLVAGYNKSVYAPEHFNALQGISDYLMAILKGGDK